MKKIILLAFIGTLFASVSAFGHCGTCDAGEKPHCEAGCEKACCEKKDKADCGDDCEKECCAKKEEATAASCGGCTADKAA